MRGNVSHWPQASVPRFLDVLPVISLSFFSGPKEYEEDVRKLRLKVDDTDRRLGAIFCQAFEDAPGLEHIFKVHHAVPLWLPFPRMQSCSRFENLSVLI